METSEPVRNYVEEKLPKVKKYIDEPVEAQVVLSVAKKIRHKAEVTLAAKGITIKATEETSDMYAAVDGVLDKLERQLKRYKDKIKKHKPLSGRERRVEKTVYTAESIDEGHTEPSIIKSGTFDVKPMSVDEAVMQMDLLEKEFLVFTDATSEEINVVYRRSDGNYGLIVPQA
jgi:putative sigma-54 modulation protein